MWQFLNSKLVLASLVVGASIQAVSAIRLLQSESHPKASYTSVDPAFGSRCYGVGFGTLAAVLSFQILLGLDFSLQAQRMGR